MDISIILLIYINELLWFTSSLDAKTTRREKQKYAWSSPVERKVQICSRDTRYHLRMKQPAHAR